MVTLWEFRRFNGVRADFCLLNILTVLYHFRALHRQKLNKGTLKSRISVRDMSHQSLTPFLRVHAARSLYPELSFTSLDSLNMVSEAKV